MVVVVRCLSPAKRGNRGVLQRQPTRQCIDLRLTFCCQTGEVCPVSFERRSTVRYLPASITRPTPGRLRQDGHHFARDLAIDDLKLPLRLSPRIFHAGQPDFEGCGSFVTQLSPV